MYSSDKKRTKKEKPRVTKTKNDRSYIKNAAVLLKKKHCLDRHYTTLHQRSSTVEKTNYLKHRDSRSISYTKTLQTEHRTISIPGISLSSVHMADLSLSAQSQHCCSRHSTQKWPLYLLKTRVSQPQELRTQQEFEQDTGSSQLEKGRSMLQSEWKFRSLFTCSAELKGDKD